MAVALYDLINVVGSSFDVNVVLLVFVRQNNSDKNVFAHVKCVSDRPRIIIFIIYILSQIIAIWDSIPCDLNAFGLLWIKRCHGN